MKKFTVEYTGKGKRSPSGVGTFHEGDEPTEHKLTQGQAASLKAKGFNVKPVRAKTEFNNTALDADEG